MVTKKLLILVVIVAAFICLARCLFAYDAEAEATRAQTQQQELQYLHDQNERYAAESRESFRRM